MDYVLETFWKRLKDILKTCYQEQINSMIRLEKVLKTSLKDVLNTFLQEVLKTFWKLLENVLARRLEDVLKTFLQDVLKTSWKRLEDVLKTYSQDEYIGLDQDVLKTSSEDVRLRRTYSSWSRRLEDVFWRRRRKMSSRRLHQDECLLGTVLIRFWLLAFKNKSWDKSWAKYSV